MWTNVFYGLLWAAVTAIALGFVACIIQAHEIASKALEKSRAYNPNLTNQEARKLFGWAPEPQADPVGTYMVRAIKKPPQELESDQAVATYLGELIKSFQEHLEYALSFNSKPEQYRLTRTEGFSAISMIGNCDTVQDNWETIIGLNAQTGYQYSELQIQLNVLTAKLRTSAQAMKQRIKKTGEL